MGSISIGIVSIASISDAPSGFITDTEQNGTIARASTVTPTVDPKVLNPGGKG